MTLTEYQMKAMTTCLPESENFAYMMLNMTGELGELASKIAKAIRKGKLEVTNNKLKPTTELTKMSGEQLDEFYNSNEELQKEAGDVLWQLSGLCSVMGWSLEDIAQQNLDKLASRQQRGVIDGSGDNR